MEYTLAEENYLKVIWKLQADNSGNVSTNDIAEKLKTKASSVTDMMMKLADKKLVNHKKYKGVRLTPAGNKIALQVMRKHRLWEVFLVEKLLFKWYEVHEIAEQLEHVRSNELTSRLDTFLGFPRFDPHGDPIPDANGEVAVRKEVCLLSELGNGNKATITGVNDSSDEFLKHLEKIGMMLGKEITVVRRDAYDGSVVVKSGKAEKTLTHRVASNLFVQKPAGKTGAKEQG